jgi:acylphosphatase
VDLSVRGFRIMGRVQGVFFRHSTRIEAERLGIRGSVRNLPDGSVEVFAWGCGPQLLELQRWLRRGPARARVEKIEELTVTEAQRAESPAGFEVL